MRRRMDVSSRRPVLQLVGFLETFFLCSDKLQNDKVHHTSDDELDGRAGVEVGNVDEKVALTFSLLSRGAVPSLQPYRIQPID